MEEPKHIWKPATILPGALLILVACSQIYLTQTSVLTPSKGGGFGMFSVIDMRRSRMWSIECLTADGTPCRALIRKTDGSLGQWLGEEFSSKPDAAARAEAADRVFRASYVPSDYAVAANDARLSETLDLLPAGWQAARLMRLSASEGAAREEPAKLRAIRFQVWRLRYDQETNRTHCEPIGEPEVRGQW